MDQDTHAKTGPLLERLWALTKDGGDRPPLPGAVAPPPRAGAVAARPDPAAGLLERLRAIEESAARPPLPERAPPPAPSGAGIPHLRQPPDAPRAWSVSSPNVPQPSPNVPQPSPTAAQPAGDFGTPRPPIQWERTPLPERAPPPAPRPDLPPGGNAPATSAVQAFAAPVPAQPPGMPPFPQAQPYPGVQWERTPLPDRAPRPAESPPPLPPGGRAPGRPEVAAFGARREAPGEEAWEPAPGLARHAEAARARLPEGGRGPLPGLGEWGGDRGGGLAQTLREGVELLRQLVQKAEAPGGGAGGGFRPSSVDSSAPPGMRPWLAWSADDPNAAEHFPAASPSVNVSSIAGLRGAGGYGYGSLQPRSVQARRNEFLEPGRRKPR